ncbi:MAG: hypothetical protein ABI661_13080, partial [Gammaproteobacteria bacterium]
TNETFCTSVVLGAEEARRGCAPSAPQVPLNFVIDQSHGTALVYGVVSTAVTKLTMVAHNNEKVPVPIAHFINNPTQGYFATAATQLPRDLRAYNATGTLIASGSTKLQSANSPDTTTR